eukprot:Transcript_11097.p1 GENE.Transcript_11097~~Transcript_11097.p1  ORF type:complete len:501 (+),score=188.95 Transcript_11097:3-1505(+)
MELALSCVYPLAHREDIKNEVAAKLRHLEKLEIAIQGDDYADKDFEETNHEALTYAKAAAAVLGCPWSFEEQLRGGREYALERLKGLPNVGEFRATQIYQLATSYFRTGECTCEALEALTLNRCPKDSDGHVRYQNNAQKQTVGAAAKLELSKLLGVSPLKAGQLYHGTLAGFDAPVCSIAELRAAVARDARAREAASGFAFGLAHYEALQRPVPEVEALEMQRLVREIVRAQQGCTHDCPWDEGVELVGALEPAARCACCWHVDFVGGARRRGRAGHDADLLVWHKVKPASWGADSRTQSVLGPLIKELEARGRLVRAGGDGWQMARMCHEHRRESVPGVRSHRRHEKQLSTSTRGFENLSTDYHDKVFGVWRSTSEPGVVHRIDIVVNSFPEELPFTLLGWTGSRLLNRLMRHHAKEMGLFLSSHALIATPQTSNAHNAEHTDVVIEARPGKPAVSVRVKSLTEVPYEFVQSEEAILRILAGGTDDFKGLYEAQHRNA